jgi:hypothetical protein
MVSPWRVMTFVAVLCFSSVTMPHMSHAVAPSPSAEIDKSRSDRSDSRGSLATTRPSRDRTGPRKATRRQSPATKKLALPGRGPRAASIAFDVGRNGFSFANWSDLGPQDDATVMTMRRLFDDSSVCAVVEEFGGCTPFSAATTFLDRLNLELTKGRCEGLAVTAYRYFTLGRSDVTSLDIAQVVDEVNYWSATQVLPAAARQTTHSRTMSLDTIAKTIYDDLLRGGGMTLGLHESSRAHTVLPIGIEIDRTSARVTVYETNTPGRPQIIDLDLITNSWTYEPLGPDGTIVDRWSGTRNLSVLGQDARRSISIDAFRPTSPMHQRETASN